MTDHTADRIVQGLTEALAHAKGEIVPDLTLHPRLPAGSASSAHTPPAKLDCNSQIIDETPE
jgi:hypothetical protein